MLRIKLSFSLLVVLLVGTMMASCSKESKLLDSIPADVAMTTTIQVKNTLTEMGASFDGGNVTLPAALSSDETASGVLTALAKADADGAINLNEVALGVTDFQDPELFATMLVADKAKLTAAFGSLIEWETEAAEGFTVGTMDGTTVVLGQDQAWFLGEKPDKAAATVKNLLEKAKKAPLSSLSGVADCLKTDALMDVAIRQTFGAKPENEKLALWNTTSVTVKDNKIAGSSQVIKGDGSPCEMPGGQPINDAVLSYIPQGVCAAFALGLTSDVPWAMLSDAIGAAGGFQARAAMGMALPYLEALDGTVMFAAIPQSHDAFTNPTPANLNLILMAHMQQQKAQELYAMATSQLSQLGAPAERDGDLTVVTLDENFRLWFGLVDGYLTVANFPVKAGQNNKLAPIFEGKEAAFFLEIPAMNLLSPSLPAYGLNVTAQGELSDGDFVMSLIGTDEPILQALLKMAE